MKELGALGFILAAAVTPRNLLLWGCLLIACVGMYIAGEQAGTTKNAPVRDGNHRQTRGSQNTTP